MAESRTWSDVEQALARLPRIAVVGLAARAARRSLPAVAALAGPYGPEAWEWMSAAESAVRVAEAFARREPVTPFTLTAGAELARAAAAATAGAARSRGSSTLVEPAEMAYAAAAFAADAARSGSDARARTLALQSTRAAAGGGIVPPEQLADLDRLLAGEDPGPIWPAGEPRGWTEVWTEFGQRAARLPRFIDWT
jgi:hypothetical protein